MHTIGTRSNRLILSFFVSLVLGGPGQSLAAERPIRIMPVGDSITVGYTDNPKWNEPFEFGYRSGLYRRLTKAGYQFQFVGNGAEPFNNKFGDPTRGGQVQPTLDLRKLGQQGHHAFGGITAAGLQGGIAAALQQHKPDIVLLKIGTNSQDRVALDKLVDTILITSPQAHLIVAEIMPKWNYQQGIVDYNNYIREDLVPKLQAQEQNITVVDQYKNFLTDLDDLKSIDRSRISNRINHPDNVGYERMAQTWFEAIEALGFKH